MIDGLLAVWKEPDYTSHDVVAKLRGILCQKKIGHTGTLDPKAEGVLVVGLGAATRALDLLPQKEKTYVAQITLGITTDTQDIWGNILEKKDACIDKEQFKEAILSFEGEYLQVPPMYSAKKVGGKKLCDLARQGKEVERKAACVTIYWIHLLSVSENQAEFEVCCSQGTYIRTLCEDIGKKLGTGACMSRLTRTAACGVSKEAALTLQEIERLQKNNELSSYIISIDRALRSYSALTVKKIYQKILLNGNAFPIEALKEKKICLKEEKFRIYLEEEGFIGVFKWSMDRQLFIPEKMFFHTGGKDGSDHNN